MAIAKSENLGNALLKKSRVWTTILFWWCTSSVEMRFTCEKRCGFKIVFVSTRDFDFRTLVARAMATYVVVNACFFSPSSRSDQTTWLPKPSSWPRWSVRRGSWRRSSRRRRRTDHKWRQSAAVSTGRQVTIYKKWCIRAPALASRLYPDLSCFAQFNDLIRKTDDVWRKGH